MDKKTILNSAQREAVKHGTGPLLIIAGAGTGKTTVIVERVKYLISQKQVRAGDILALTFTEKSAREMEMRIDQALPLGYSNMEIGTFHSFGERLLREEAVHLGLSPNFRLMTEAETLLFMERHWFDLSLKYFRPATNPKKYLGALISHFSRLRDEVISPKDYLKFAEEAEEKDAAQKWNKKEWLELAKVYGEFQSLKAQEAVVDFADLLYCSYLVLKERPQVRKRWQEKFKYILVDEYQDTNIAQNEVVKLLAGKQANVTVVADDDQAIYRFRGAAVSNVIQFRRDFPKTKLVTLVKNYRSTQAILDSSYQLISHNNPDRLELMEKIDKRLVATREKGGETPKSFRLGRVEEEAEKLAELAREEKKQGRDWKEMAVLVRANNHAEPFMEALGRAGIPYQFLGPGKLFRRGEIKDLMAWLKLLENPSDEVAFFRVASIGLWDIPERDLAFLRGAAKRQGKNQMELVGEILDGDGGGWRPTEEGRGGWERLYGVWKKQLKELKTESGGQILYNFLEESGWLDQLAAPKTEAQEQEAVNIGRFFEKIKAFETDPENRNWRALLDWMNLKMEMGESPLAGDTDWTEVDAVNILTVHSAKGLEFPVVFLVNLVSGRFPGYKRAEQLPIPEALLKEILPVGDAQEQEERRLFYVGMTRAREKLYLLSAKYYQEEAKRERKLSPFVVEALGEAGLKTEGKVSPKQLDWTEGWNKKEEEVVVEAWGREVNYLSYSQIDSFNTCSLQYKYRYVLGIPTTAGPALVLGQALHQSLRDFYLRWRAETIKGEWGDLKNIFEGAWKGTVFGGQKEKKKSKKEAEEKLKDYFLKEVRGKKKPLILGLEEPFKIRLGTLSLGGRIDRIDELQNGEVEVVDYKTGKAKGQKEVDQDEQMTIYALAVARLAGVAWSRKAEKIKLSFYYLGEGEKVSTRRTEEQLVEAEKKILETAKEIEKSEFPAKPNKPFPCDFCEYKLICEAWR